MFGLRKRLCWRMGVGTPGCAKAPQLEPLEARLLLSQGVPTAEIWHEVGLHSATGGGVSNDPRGCRLGAPAIAVDQSSGEYYVAWASGEEEICVLRWNGTQWCEVGAGSAGGGISTTPAGESAEPAIAVRQSDHHVFVAWSEEEEEGSAKDIYAAEFDGTAWVRLGEANGNVSSTPGWHSDKPSIIIRPNSNQPVIAWQERFPTRDNDAASGTTGVFVREWTGLSWREMGMGSAGRYPNPEPGRPPYAGGVNADDGVPGHRWLSWSPELVTGPLGNVAVVFGNWQWRDNRIEYPYGIHLRRFTGDFSGAACEVWEDVARVEGGDPEADPILSVSPQSNIAVAGEAMGSHLFVAADVGQANQNELRVLQWTGSGWRAHGPVGYDNPELQPLATGSGWYETPLFPSIARGADDELYVAWTEFTPGTQPDDGFQREVYVRRSQMDAGGAVLWKEVGSGSATGGGISDNGGESGFPVLAVDRHNGANTPVVAWYDAAGSGVSRIYVRRACADGPDRPYQPVQVLNPVGSPDSPVGHPYRITWSGGDEHSGVTIWSLGPKGWQVVAEDLSGTDRLCDWDTSAAAPGSYLFCAREDRRGNGRLSSSPGWLKVVEPGAGKLGASLGATGVEPRISPAQPGLASGIEGWASVGGDDQALAVQSVPINAAGLAENAVRPDGQASEEAAPREPGYATVVCQGQDGSRTGPIPAPWVWMCLEGAPAEGTRADLATAAAPLNP